MMDTINLNRGHSEKFRQPFCEKLLVSVVKKNRKKNPRFNNFSSDEYPYLIL